MKAGMSGGCRCWALARLQGADPAQLCRGRPQGRRQVRSSMCVIARMNTREHEHEHCVRAA
eukprot:3654383-Rhodomonas_salina.1